MENLINIFETLCITPKYVGRNLDYNILSLKKAQMNKIEKSLILFCYLFNNF